MAYKILINSKGVPVLVEIHEPDRKLWFRSEATPADNIAALKKLNSESLSTALADESKHIAFKNEKFAMSVVRLQQLKIYEAGRDTTTPPFLTEVGQTFDLPENIGVSFEGVCCRGKEFAYQSLDSCFDDLCTGKNTLAILTPQAKEDKPATVAEPLNVIGATVEKNTILSKHLGDERIDKQSIRYAVYNAMQEYATVQRNEAIKSVETLMKASKRALMDDPKSNYLTNRISILQEVLDLIEDKPF